MVGKFDPKIVHIADAAQNVLVEGRPMVVDCIYSPKNSGFLQFTHI
jgi:hypothetical protein